MKLEKIMQELENRFSFPQELVDDAIAVPHGHFVPLAAKIKQEVNIWDKYNLGRDDLAKKLGITGPKTSALILELKIQDDQDCFKVLRRKSTTFKGYSKTALDRLQSAITDGIDVDATWKKHRNKFGAKKRK